MQRLDGGRVGRTVGPATNQLGDCSSIGHVLHFPFPRRAQRLYAGATSTRAFLVQVEPEGEYHVERYSTSRRADVVAMHRSLMPRNSGVNERYFSWKYEQNPYIGEPTMALVYSGDRLVAMRGLYGSMWRDPHGMSPHLIGHVDDLFVHPDHRQRGLFLLLDKELRAAASEHGCSTIISLSGSPTTQRLAEATGWSALKLERRLRVGAARPTSAMDRMRSTPAVGTVLSKSMGALRRTGRGFQNAPSARLADRTLAGLDDSSPRISVTATPDLDAVSALAQQTPKRGWHHDRSPAFYEWRLGNPDRTYRFVTWTDNRLRAYVLLALMPHDARHVKIADHATEDPAFLHELLEAIAANENYDIEVLDSGLESLSPADLDRIGFRVDAAEQRLHPRSFMERAVTPGRQVRNQRIWDFDLIDSMLA